MIPFYEINDQHLRAFYTEDFSFPDHLHKEMEFVLMLERTLDLSIGGCSYTLQPGDLAVILPNTIHHYLPSQKRCLLVICGPELFGGYAPMLQGSVPECPVVSAASIHPDITYALLSLEQEGRGGQQEAVYKALLQLICARLQECMVFRKQENPPSADLTTRLLQYIGARYLEPLSLEQAAEDLCVSKYHLSRIFSGRLQIGFNDYVNRLRLDYAAHLIRSTQDSLTNICYASGFESQRTFNRAFLKQYRITPGEYRKGGRQNTIRIENRKVENCSYDIAEAGKYAESQSGIYRGAKAAL